MSSDVYVRYDFYSEDETDQHTLVASVKEFSKILSGKKSEFVTESVFQYQIKIVLSGHNNDIIDIYFSTPTPLFVKAVLTLCLARYQERSIVMLDYHTVAANKWQYLTNLYRRDIEQNSSEYLLADDTLRLKLKLMVNNAVTITSTIPKMLLNEDFEKLLLSGLFSDLTMNSADGTEFRVHKNVLASRSTVLRALLENDMSEKHSNIVESPFDGEILRQVLTYMYSDRSPGMDEVTEKLLAAADYYHLDGLKSICEEALFRNVTVENCMDVLQLADLHSAQNLKLRILEFIKHGNQTAITETDTWKSISSADIVKTLYEFIISDGIDKCSL